MDIGCHLPTQGPLATGEALTTFAREADRRGIASLWVSDHVIFPRTATGSYPGGRFPHPPDKPYLEPVVALAAAAVCTTRARLGASVFILGHRHPVVMAKMLTSIDALSDGRLICGVGVGWWKEELEILGVPFNRRGRQADEILKVSRRCGRTPTRRSRASSSASAMSASRPSPCRSRVRRSGSAATAPAPSGASPRWATAGTRPRRRPPSFARPSPRLRAAADQAGRAFDTIELSLRYTLRDDLLAKGTQAVVDILAEYKGLGLSHMLLEFRRDDLGRMLEILDLVTSAVRPTVDRA